MRTVHIRSVSIAAIAVLTFAGSVAAQEKPSGLLNSLEVQQLVKRAEPGDNARLAAHFTALADRYAAEAKRHTSMAQSFVGNPSRNLGSGMSAHCKQLANLNTQSATELRELASYHQKLASGATATPPAAGAGFEGGAGAPAPTDQELNAMSAKASTPADHRALEEVLSDVGETLHERGGRPQSHGECLQRIAQEPWMGGWSRRTLRPSCDAVRRVSQRSSWGCRHAQAARRRRPVTVAVSVRAGASAGPAEIASSMR